MHWEARVRVDSDDSRIAESKNSATASTALTVGNYLLSPAFRMHIGVATYAKMLKIETAR